MLNFNAMTVMQWYICGTVTYIIGFILAYRRMRKWSRRKNITRDERYNAQPGDLIDMYEWAEVRENVFVSAFSWISCIILFIIIASKTIEQSSWASRKPPKWL